MSGSGKVNKNMYHIFSIKSENPEVFWTFHVAVMQINGKEMYKKVCCNRPFYRYGGHIELIGFKEYYIGCSGGMSTFRLYFRALLGTFFLKVFLE